MRALIVGDIHLSDRPPSIRTDAYADQIIDKLMFTTEVASKLAVDFVVWAGDVFHLKAPTRTSHALVQRVCDVIKAYDRALYIVPGNHDLQHDRLDTLERQPLGVLFKAGAIPLVGTMWEQYRGHNLFGIPWLSDWREELPRYMEQWRSIKAPLMVTHAPIVQPGQDRPYEVIDADDWARLMGRRGDVYFGHMHDVDGAFCVDDFVFCNQGALSRGSIHESSLARAPAVTLYDSDQLYQQKFRRIEVPHLPAEQVFKLADKATDDAREDRLDEFLDSIGKTTLESVSVEGVIADLRERGIRKEVLDEVTECFEVTS